MSVALNQAIVKRVRSEDLTGYDDAVAAQAVANQYPIRYGVTDTEPKLPCITFYEDAGSESMGGVDIGIIQNAVYRFQVWTRDRTGDFIPRIASALEQLFDMRRGAPPFTLDGDGRVYWSDLFVPLQSPMHNDEINAFFGMIAFRFVEARP